MDAKELSELVSDLVAKNEFKQAEALLLEERAKTDVDTKTQVFVLTELVELYCLMQPPLLQKAVALSEERERLVESAYSKLQTAMVLHHGANDYARAVLKLQDTIAQGKAEQDDRTVYTALGLLGQASLELGNTEQATTVLSELEKMVTAKRVFVVGDETCFLEGLRARRLETARVSHLASILTPACRDIAFKERLRALAVP
jgi:hypothetical protein